MRISIVQISVTGQENVVQTNSMALSQERTIPTSVNKKQSLSVCYFCFKWQVNQVKRGYICTIETCVIHIECLV
jgi:hypothetical protein